MAAWAACVPLLALLLLGVAPPSSCQRDTPYHRRTTKHTDTIGLNQKFSYDTPAYSHMLARPSDAFPEPKSGAWVYFVGVASAEKRHYLHWALSSIQCLQNAGTKYDFVVIFEGEDDIAIQALKAVGVHKVYKYEEYLKSLKGVDLSAFEEANKESEKDYYHAWNKLLAWTMTDYEKAVLVDSDVICWHNADELFLFPELAAVPDSVWPLMSEEYAEYFNTGVMVIRPDLEMFRVLSGGIKAYQRPYQFWWDTSEQTYLNAFFNTTWYHLPISFNYFGFILDGAFRVNWRTQGLKLVHHLRESQFEIPADEAECDNTSWVSCKACCHHLAKCRDDAFERVEAAGITAERLGAKPVKRRPKASGKRLATRRQH